jgi:hypothetical protein
MAGEDSMHTPVARSDTRITFDDFVLFPDDGKRHEIIAGAAGAGSTPGSTRCRTRITA